MASFRVVVAGCGGMARTWVQYALRRSDVEIVGLVDLFEEAALAMKQDFALSAATYRRVEDAILDTGANLVFDVTIPASHKQVVLTALSLGCDVFGEKPMSDSLADAYAMLEAAKATGKTYAVMQNRRYDARIRALRDIVQSGAIGQVGMIHADFFLGAHFGGFRDEMDYPLILDMAIHTFDQARFITGANPVSVYCASINPPGSWYKGDAAAICTYEFSDGTVFSYRGSWASEGGRTSWEASWRVNGSVGTALWDGEHAPTWETVSPEQTGFLRDPQNYAADLTWDGRSGHEGCLDEMFLALIEGRHPETDCRDNIYSTAMMFAAIESATKREVVKIEVP